MRQLEACSPMQFAKGPSAIVPREETPYSRELQFGPVGLEGGEICRSLGSINDVNEEVDEVPVLVGVFSVLAACIEIKE